MPEASVQPVVPTPNDAVKPLEENIAISLSGGGYRAMLFHVGSLWRLAQLNILTAQRHTTASSAGEPIQLGALQRISSVSGGSIAAAQLALHWQELAQAAPDRRDAIYRSAIVDPIRRLARISLAGYDLAGIVRVLASIILPGSVNRHLANAYARHLYGKATLRDLPESPRFVLNASNLQSGALWRFSRPYVADWRVGKMMRTEKVSIAEAVAASSAFPPILAPADFRFDPADYEPGSGAPGEDNLQRPPFTTRPRLVDGGVYDNLGLETTYKRFRTLLVSNGGAPFDPAPKVARNWVSLGSRVIGLMNHQVGSLRKRLLVAAFERQERHGAFWDIEQDIRVHRCADALPCPSEQTRLLAALPTDLAAKDEATQMRLINWGYAVADAALRAHLNRAWPRPAGFPYPEAGVG